MIEHKNQVSAGLAAAFLWGSLWGLWEATAGYLAHLTHIPGLPGFIMAPAALYFMSRAFAEAGKIGSVFLTACVAAGLKLLDIFIPGRTLQAVINPALAILLESLAVAGFYALLGSMGLTGPVFGRLKRTVQSDEHISVGPYD